MRANHAIDDGGQRVVYLMRGGESFARVPVRLGLRDGDRYEVLEGLQPGDRVVTSRYAQFNDADELLIQ